MRFESSNMFISFSSLAKFHIDDTKVWGFIVAWDRAPYLPLRVFQSPFGRAIIGAIRIVRESVVN